RYHRNPTPGFPVNAHGQPARFWVVGSPPDRCRGRRGGPRARAAVKVPAADGASPQVVGPRQWTGPPGVDETSLPHEGSCASLVTRPRQPGVSAPRPPTPPHTPGGSHVVSPTLDVPVPVARP